MKDLFLGKYIGQPESEGSIREMAEMLAEAMRKPGKSEKDEQWIEKMVRKLQPLYYGGVISGNTWTIQSYKLEEK